MNKLLITLAMLSLLWAGPSVRADEDEEQDSRPTRVRRVEVQAVTVGKHWLGVQTMPVDEALKSHLGIEQGLLIERVLPESPAAKAELQRYDIVLQLGERDIKEMKDLVEAVQLSEGKPTPIRVLRGGKERRLEIQPVERPSDYLIERDPNSFWRPLDRWLGGEAEGENGPLRVRVIGPGILSGAAVSLPDNLSINVTREGDQPARITVKRDDETWEVTEETLDKLPEDLRPHVQRLLGRGPAARLDWLPEVDGRIRIHPVQPPPVVGERPGGVPAQLDEALRRLKELEERLSREDPFKALREEMESLRREVERLRPRRDRSPSDREPPEDRDA